MAPGAEVRFRLGDILCPDRNRVLQQVTHNLELHAVVTQFCNDADRSESYAVLDVTGVESPIIVPVERLAVRKITPR